MTNDQSKFGALTFYCRRADSDPDKFQSLPQTFSLETFYIESVGCIQRREAKPESRVVING